MTASEVCERILYGDDVETDDMEDFDVMDIEGNVISEE